MDYQLSKLHKLLKESMERFCREEIAPAAAFLDTCSAQEAADTMKANFKRLSREGYTGLLLDDDLIGQAVAGEELAKACPATFLSALSSLTALGRMVKRYGSPKQQEEVLSELAGGEKIGAMACNEGDAGADMGGMTTTADYKGGRWILNGNKDIVTNAPFADFFLVLAWTKRDAALEAGTTFFLIDRHMEGLSVGDTLETMGLCGARAAGISLENCSLPEDAVLGGAPGVGWAQMQSAMDDIRIAVSVLCLGIGMACMEDSTRHAKAKKAFGKPIGLFEGVGAKLATMFTFNDIGRMMVYRAAWGREQFDPESPILSSCAKLYTTEAVEQIASMAMQVHGGHGYLKGETVERLYRDARFAALAYGTSEMQRAFIAKDTLDNFKAA